MGRNVEIKACAGDLGRKRALAEALADGAPRVLFQEDTFYAVSRGRLKLRVLNEAEGELIYYERPDTKEPTTSAYRIFRTDNAASLKDVLGSALKVRGVVKKKRTFLMSGQTRIHLDEVEGLGDFVELEVVLKPGQDEAEGRKIAEGLMDRLEIKTEDLLREAYLDLLDRREGK